jgi:hypothetical protein
MAVHPSMFFNGICCLEYKGGYALIVIDSDVDASVGVEPHYLNSPAPYEGQLPPVSPGKQYQVPCVACLRW